jgi:hypothetical protein
MKACRAASAPAASTTWWMPKRPWPAKAWFAWRVRPRCAKGEPTGTLGVTGWRSGPFAHLSHFLTGIAAIHPFSRCLSRPLPRRGSRRVARHFRAGWAWKRGCVPSGRGEGAAATEPGADTAIRRGGPLDACHPVSAPPYRPDGTDFSFNTPTRHGSAGLLSSCPLGAKATSTNMQTGVRGCVRCSGKSPSPPPFSHTL